jgi:hypothetical protein
MTPVTAPRRSLRVSGFARTRVTPSDCAAAPTDDKPERKWLDRAMRGVPGCIARIACITPTPPCLGI